MENLPRNHPVLDQIEIGVGTWAWGDRLVWDYGQGYQDVDIRAAFKACIESGVVFFDTAEIYGQGQAEILLGKFIREANQKVVVATKFMPFPWRLTHAALKSALKRSIKRLGISKVDLYQIHMPLPPVTIESWMEAMVESVQADLISAVGVSNYDRSQTQRAYDVLNREGIHLASNQVEFNLLNRSIEKNGLLKQCQEMGIRVIAYSPLAMGMLTGKYSTENMPHNLRGWKYNRSVIPQITQLISVLNQVGANHGGKTPAQVALNWVIGKGAIPIPGAKNAVQADQNSGAVGWHLTDQEIVLLDEVSDKIEQ